MRCHGWLKIVCLLASCSVWGGCRAGARQAEQKLVQKDTGPEVVLAELEATARTSQRSSPARASSNAIVTVSHMQDELPVPSDSLSAEPPEVLAGPESLELRDVIISVRQAYPLLVSARLERQIADGKQQSAWGEFDLEVKAFGIATPEGYYQTYRNGIALEQPVFSGGYMYGGYKIGDGNFQPWYGERQTNEGGEFSVGFGVPLLQGREIDKRREALFQADLARQAVEPMVQTQFFEFVRTASRIYWSWVASGQALEAQRELLTLARQRVKQIEERVNAGDLPQIARLNNEQLIASRETKVIESERKLQQAAIKLSLFLRGIDGEPFIPDKSQLPKVFPPHATPSAAMLDSDIAQAVNARPELKELDLIAEQIRVELAQAKNLLLPKLDARILGSKDVGAAASSKGDKTPFELEAGLYGELPLQRREARGKIDSARAKLAQIEVKRRFVVNKVTASVQDAVSALEAAAGRIERAGTNLRLARQTLALGRDQFNAGDINLIELNIYEQSATDAQFLLIAAQADFFAALADYRAALSLDPLKAVG